MPQPRFYPPAAERTLPPGFVLLRLQRFDFAGGGHIPAWLLLHRMLLVARIARRAPRSAGPPW